MTPGRMTRMSGWSSRQPAAAGAGRPGRRCRSLAQRRHQVTDIVPAPPPKVTEYVAQAKAVPVLRDGQRGRAAGHVRAAGQLTARRCIAQAANLACGHHIPVARAAVLLGQLGGSAVSVRVDG